MKQIICLLNLLIISYSLTMAQLPANRTVNTKIADALALLPVSQQEEYRRIMNDLLTTSEEGVFMMIKMINKPGEGSNAPIDYALSGLSRYVTEAGQEKNRIILANAYCKALEATSETETKAFLIRQLALVGTDESVATLKKYLNNDELSGAAARALASIHTPGAVDALSSVLTMSTVNNKKNIVKALGETASISAESDLRSLLGSGDNDLEKEVLYALSRCGSKASLSLLAQYAEKSGYTLEYSEANEAYIRLIKRVLAQGDVKDAGKAATDLMERANKYNQVHTQSAALEIILAANEKDRNKYILAALDNENKEFRNTALFYATSYSDASLYSGIVNKLKKSKPDTKADIIIWLGNQHEQSVLTTLLPYMNDSNPDVAIAAIRSVGKIGNENSIETLSGVLMSTDIQKVTVAKEALASFKGNISPQVVKVLANSSTVGKVAAIELLALRKADRYSSEIFAQLINPENEIKTAAFHALKDVVMPKDLPRLYNLLENANKAEIIPLQQAVIAALADQSKEQQFSIISNQMEKAGKTKQYLFYPILASTGLKQALPILSDGLYSEQNETKDAALDAFLFLINSPTYTPENKVIFLREAMKVAENDEQRNEILEQIGRTGTFQALIFCGKQLDNPVLKQTTANAVMRISLNHPEYTGEVAKNLLSKTASILDNQDAEYQKKAILKHLAEMPDEKGFVSLFNEKDITGWKGLVKNPIDRNKMKPQELKVAQQKADELARQAWVVEDGVLLFKGKGDNLCTERQYGDFELYVDWLLYPGSEPDAGIYLRGTPQVQIWDTARVDVGAQVGSGGLYNNTTNPSHPLKVADNKVGEWNSFYMKMIGERVTVYLNGELVVDNVILENYWDRKSPIFPVEQIELQAHGSKVAYRDLYIREIEQVKPFRLSEDEKKEGFQILFDGTTLNEWTGNTTDYTTKDGCIVLDPAGRSGGNLYTKAEYGNFIYRFEFQLTPAANNGVGIRTPMGVDAAYAGMEIQVLDSEAPVYQNLEKYQYHGSVYGIIPAKRGFLKPLGEWNYEEIYANGDYIKVTLNGEVILDGNIKDATKNGTLDHKEHPGLFNKSGHIGFLGHGSEVKFRNIRIKNLDNFKSQGK